MVSRIEPDRYADTGFGVKDTPPEVNKLIFEAMMSKTPEERFLMGLNMMATARELVWSGIQSADAGNSTDEAHRLFYLRFHGTPRPW
jgi:hypothetical protein